MDTYDYAQCETVLAGMYEASDVQRGAFRGRLKHLRRLGVPMVIAPGKGAKADYGIDHLYQWSFALELEEALFDPNVIAGMIKKHWKSDIRANFLRAAKGHVTQMMIPIALMSCNWTSPQSRFPGVLGITGIGEDARASQMFRDSRRVLAIDISATVEALKAGLAHLGGNHAPQD